MGGGAFRSRVVEAVQWPFERPEGGWPHKPASTARFAVRRTRVNALEH